MKVLKKSFITALLRGKLSFMLFSISACGIFIGFIAPAEEFNDLAKYRLKGSVKSLMEIKYALGEKSDSAVKGWVMFQKYTLFNLDGYEYESTLFKDGEEYLTSKYLFGADGKQVEMDEYNTDGSLNLHVTYKFDKKGFRSEADFLWSEDRKIGELTEIKDYYYEILQNDLYTKVLYKNEYRGYCLEEDYLKADSTLSFKFISAYDFRGNKVQSAYYHKSGRLSWMSKYKYDRYDSMIESRTYKSNRIAVLSRYKYQLDTVGNWVIRNESRKVYVNVLTAGLDRANTVTERIIEYY